MGALLFHQAGPAAPGVRVAVLPVGFPEEEVPQVEEVLREDGKKNEIQISDRCLRDHYMRDPDAVFVLSLD